MTWWYFSSGLYNYGETEWISVTFQVRQADLGQITHVQTLQHVLCTTNQFIVAQKITTNRAKQIRNTSTEPLKGNKMCEHTMQALATEKAFHYCDTYTYT